ncbi:unnamed protein product, partial [Ectocarpus fasciculatus]
MGWGAVWRVSRLICVCYSLGGEVVMCGGGFSMRSMVVVCCGEMIVNRRGGRLTACEMIWSFGIVVSGHFHSKAVLLQISRSSSLLSTQNPSNRSCSILDFVHHGSQFP